MKHVLFLAGAVVALDQFTKAIALDRLPSGVAVQVIDGFLSLILVMNPGLAFGLLGTMPAGWRWVVAALSIAALLVLARVALRVLPAAGWPGRLAVGLIFGGAVGNLIDRARFGAVVDFIDAHWRGYHWPAFNVADSAISIGVVLLVIDILRQPQAGEAPQPPRVDAGPPSLESDASAGPPGVAPSVARSE